MRRCLQKLFIIESLKEQWKREKIDLNIGLSSNEINLWEVNNKAILPDDMKAFFLEINGMTLNSCDKDLIRFWSLGELKPLKTLSSELAVSSYISRPDTIYIFADYTIMSHFYAIRLTASEQKDCNEIYVIGYSKPLLVANSFTTFLKLYLNDPIDNWSFLERPVLQRPD
jgi:hypothetical protein